MSSPTGSSVLRGTGSACERGALVLSSRETSLTCVFPFRCKESKMTLFAEVHPPDPYEAPAQLNTSGSVNTTEPEELMQNSTTQQQVPSSTAAGLHTHTPWTSSPATHTPWPSPPPTPIAEVSASAALSRAVSDPGASPTRNQSASDPLTRNQSASDLRGNTHRWHH